MSYPLISSFTCQSLHMRCFLSKHFRVRDINLITFYYICKISSLNHLVSFVWHRKMRLFFIGNIKQSQDIFVLSKKRILITHFQHNLFIKYKVGTLPEILYHLFVFYSNDLYNFNQQVMATNFDWVKLQNQNDYKFFACVVAQKLRNTNFKPAWREVFLKTLLEQIKPVCTFRTYERIEKLLNQVANQKHQEEKEQEERKKIASNIKDKGLKSLKAEKTKKNYGIDEDEESYSDEDDEEF